MRKAVGIASILALLLSPLAADAQLAGKVYRLGFLGGGSAASYADWIAPLRQGLQELGYEEGKNIVIEGRWADGKTDRLRGLAGELVQLKVDIIIAMGTGPSRAAKDMTATIPIVMAGGSDPLGAGLVGSLARPGGNITGTTSSNVELSGKRLELLREISPGISGVAVLGLANYPSTPLSLKDVEDTGRALGVRLQILLVRGQGEIDNAIAAATKERAGALLVLGGPLRDHYETIAGLALKNRLPAISPYRYFPQRGGLVSYGPSMAEPYRRAATYVDRILKGTKPADLPVEQPTKLELVINLKVAKALGLTIPPSVLMRADEVIE